MPSDATPRPGLPTPAEPYVLLADADVERAVVCLKIVKAQGVGALVTTTGDEAGRVIDRLGPPAVLLIDLSLPGRSAFEVIEAACAGDSQTAVVAWSPDREVREFAVIRLAGFHVRILRESARPAVIEAAVGHALARHVAARPAESAAPALTAEQLHELMNAITDEARGVCTAPGVAVYARAPGTTQFRASVTWWSDTPMPPSPTYLAQVFDWVIASGRSLVAPDLAAVPLPDLPASLRDLPESAQRGDVRGLAAVPIVTPAREIVGTLCVFDVAPLTLADSQVRSLEGLGRAWHRFVPAAPAAPAAPVAPEAPVASAARPRELRAVPAEPPAPIESFAPLLARQHGEFAIAREVARARREQQPLSVVLFHVGPLDRGGLPPPDAADTAIALTGETLLRAIRQSDLPIRWSDDELLLVLPGLGAAEARMVAERVRAALQAGGRYRLAVAGGVTELQPDEPFGAALARAAEQMRRARDAGRNHVA